MVLTERVDGTRLTGYELAALGRLPFTGWTGRLATADRTAVVEAVDATGALPLASRLVEKLNDGERQRILIARALAEGASLLLLDEVTAFLDLPGRLDIMRLLRDLAHTTGRGVLLSKHDLELALRSADRIWLLPGDGTLPDGAPEDLILEGHVEAAFRADGLRFDSDARHFTWAGPKRGAVRVTGNGQDARWARRLLERLGFTAAGDREQSAVEIRVGPTASGRRWRVEWQGGHCQCRSLAQVGDVLCRRSSASARRTNLPEWVIRGRMHVRATYRVVLTAVRARFPRRLTAVTARCVAPICAARRGKDARGCYLRPLDA